VTQPAQRPAVLIFDVNETLLDIEVMHSLFGRVFGREDTLREWFNSLVMYSMTCTLANHYEDFFSLARGVFEMMGGVYGKPVYPADLDELAGLMRTLPAHSDVEPALQLLQRAGFRMVTLTNSPVRAGARSPLDNAGLGGFFERQFSVDACRAFKPSQAVYHMVSRDLDVAPASCCMVAAHVWDIIGAQAAGMCGALVARKGNAPLPLPGLPPPHIVESGLIALASRIIEHRER
jgi:2-haloacid dehalogenase